jgi:hypothetical protein
MSPIAAAVSASSGHPFRTAPESATEAWVASAPMTRLSPSTAMSANPAIRPMSTTLAGCAARSFMAGMRLWPPATSLASGSEERSSTASATEAARW